MLQRTSPAAFADSERSAVLLAAFRDRLAQGLPFREDRALLDALLSEAEPALETLWRAYDPGDASGCAKHEGFALWSLLCRRAGLLGATPTTCVALARGLSGALLDSGADLSAGQQDELAIVAAEGYCAGRDERNERALRTSALEAQACRELAPGCYLVCLAGSHHAEALQARLEQLARELFQCSARSVLVDVRGLTEADEDSARALAAFAFSLLSLGLTVVIHGSATRFADFFTRLSVQARGALLEEDFAHARKRALAAAGFTLRPHSPLSAWLTRLRPPATRD